MKWTQFLWRFHEPQGGILLSTISLMPGADRITVAEFPDELKRNG
jgi:hypothetical protein